MTHGQDPKAIPSVTPKQPPKSTDKPTGDKPTRYPVGWTNWGMHGPRASGPLAADPGRGQ